jgi:3-oxoadipate enol-lactonase
LRPLAADEQGGGGAVVLLHGQPGDRHDWDAVVAVLDSRVRTIVPDRPGYGRTGGRAGGPAANAEAVVDLLTRRRVDRAVIVGHSWGGAVALEVALRHPDRVSALVLVSSVGGPGSTGTLDRLLGVPLLGPALSLGGLALLRAARVRRLLAPGFAPALPAALEALPDGWLASWPAFVAEQRALLRELPGITRRLADVEVPVAVLVGTADRVVPPASQAALAARLARAEVVRAPGCGHLLPREAPQLVADTIVRMGGPPVP